MDITSDYQFSIEHKAKIEHVQMVENGLIEYNYSFFGPKERFCIFIRGPEGEILGGSTGHYYTMHRILFLDYVHIDKNLRRHGIGTQLLREVEEEAKRLGCKTILLDTFSFQAEPFYSKQGYKRIAIIENQVANFDRIYMRKDLEE